MPRSIQDESLQVYNALFCKDYGIASHTIRIVCVDSIREWRVLLFNVDSERHIFGETFS